MKQSGTVKDCLLPPTLTLTRDDGDSVTISGIFGRNRDRVLLPTFGWRMIDGE